MKCLVLDFSCEQKGDPNISDIQSMIQSVIAAGLSLKIFHTQPYEYCGHKRLLVFMFFEEAKD